MPAINVLPDPDDREIATLERRLIDEGFVPVTLGDAPDWLIVKVASTGASFGETDNWFEIEPGYFDAEDREEPLFDLAAGGLGKGIRQTWTPLWAVLVHDAGCDFFTHAAQNPRFRPSFHTVLASLDLEAQAALVAVYQLGGLRATRRMLLPRYVEAERCAR